MTVKNTKSLLCCHLIGEAILISPHSFRLGITSTGQIKMRIDGLVQWKQQKRVLPNDMALFQ